MSSRDFFSRLPDNPDDLRGGPAKPSESDLELSDVTAVPSIRQSLVPEVNVEAEMDDIAMLHRAESIKTKAYRTGAHGITLRSPALKWGILEMVY